MPRSSPRWSAPLLLRLLLIGAALPIVAPAEAEPSPDPLAVIAVVPAVVPAAAGEEAVREARDRERLPAQLETVVVTARQRPEAAAAVPISMTVLDGNQLSDAGLLRPQDMAERVPGLVVSVPNPRFTSYSLRGLGTSSANAGLESSVGVFLDGVYLGRQGMSTFDLVDLDRVEVLRGPQGTLFGKNTTAGALNIVTQLPTPQFQARGEISAGNLGYAQARGTISGPLLPTLSGRLTAYGTRRDGVIDNLVDARRFNGQHRGGVRGQLLWQPTEALRNRLIAEVAATDESCCVYPLTLIRNSIAQRDAYMEYQREPAQPFARQVRDDTRIGIEVQQLAFSDQLDWSLGDERELTSITAYRRWHYRPFNDDATSMRLAPLSGAIEHQHQFSQELRLRGRDADLQWLAGLFFLDQTIDSLDRFVVGADLLPWVYGGLLRENGLPLLTRSNSGALFDLVTPGKNAEGAANLTHGHQTSRSVAAFGSTDWAITEQLDLSAGLRYTHETKQASVDRRRVQPGSQVDTSAGDYRQLPGAVLAAAGISDPRNLTIDVLLDQAIGGAYARATNYAEGRVSGQLALGYQWIEGLRSYASVAQGYKAGGINLGVIGMTTRETFKPETATNFELGLKSELLQHRLGVDLAVYHTEVRDYQALTYDNDPSLFPNRLQTNLLNVGRVTLNGAELETRWLAGSHCSLRGGAAYNRAITEDFRNAPDESSRTSTKNLSGKHLYNAPPWTATAGVDYRHPLTPRVEATAGADFSHRSGYFGTVERGAGSQVDAHDLLNVSGGLRTAGGLEVALWVRNLLDEQYLAAINPTYGVGDYGAVLGDDRTYGLTLRAAIR